MNPRQEWGAFALVFVLLDIIVVAVLVELGLDLIPVLLFGFVAIFVFLYIVYKRYHIEVVPESDIALFEHPDDLRILSGIYGLDSSGDEAGLRQKLVDFSRKNRSRSFVWIAPRAISSIASSLEITSATPRAPSGPVDEDILQKVLHEPEQGMATRGGLLYGKDRSESRRHSIANCPVCDAPARRKDVLCRECGADLEFYLVLSESRLGKRLLSEKARASGRKLRYGRPAIKVER